MQKKKWTVVLIVICILSLSCNALLINRGGYVDKVLVKVGLKEYEAPTDWTLESWRSSLRQMDADADVVFFGDSITRGGAWSDAFQGVNIVNLGISGDSIRSMTCRVDMIASVKPEKVFILCGINSLTDHNSTEILKQYKEMLAAVHEAVPEAEIYVQSILPISVEKEKECADNTVIESFNTELEKLAAEAGAAYINIHDLYELDGSMNPDLTKDGIHLKPEAYDLWYKAIEGYVYE